MTQTKPPIGSETKTLCSVCAWRADCKKKYSFEQGGFAKCPDYARDMTIPTESDTSNEG